MNNIVYTTFAGAPTQNSGGPNNIIYKLLKSLDYDKYCFTFISKHYKISSQSFNENLISKDVNKLYFTNSLYRKIVTTNAYLLYHYYNGTRYFKKLYNSESFGNSILHSHDILSFCNSENKFKKTILTIHTKGSYAKDFSDYRKSSYMLKNLLSKLRQNEKEAYDSADIVTFPSIAAKELFLEETGILDHQKAHVIYNGIDLEEIKKISAQSIYFGAQEKDSIYILNVADHIGVKNIDRVLKLVSILKNKMNKNVKLFNAGTGPLTEYYFKICRELNIAQNVRFLGRVDNSTLISLMKNCNYFISLSDRVIFDVSILEALACEMIVIANNVGGNREVIKSGVNGYLVNANEIEDIAEIILENNKKQLQIDKTEIHKYSLLAMMSDYSLVYSI